MQNFLKERVEGGVGVGVGVAAGMGGRCRVGFGALSAKFSHNLCLARFCNRNFSHEHEPDRGHSQIQ